MNTTEIPLEPLLARAREQTNPVAILNPSVLGRSQIATQPRVSRLWSLTAAAALALVALAALWSTREASASVCRRPTAPHTASKSNECFPTARCAP